MTERDTRSGPDIDPEALHHGHWDDGVCEDEPQRGRASAALWSGIGLAAAVVIGLFGAGVWYLTGAPDDTEMALPAPSTYLRTHPDTREDHDGAIPPAGALADGADWMFAPGLNIGQRRFAGTTSSPAPSPGPAIGGVPLPPSNPLGRHVGDLLADVPMPDRNPLGRADRGGDVASLPVTPGLPPVTYPDPGPGEPVVKTEVPLPTPGSGYALYDITGKTVYMPNGERLEAHSGYGNMFDDPRHVDKKMRGPTPPNTYELAMREALFHGVEAIRMRPVGDGKMYGRNGILSHSYLLGPRGDSNGCVSFKDYDKFLAAFKRGEVSRMIVVADLANAPNRNPLLSWLNPR